MLLGIKVGGGGHEYIRQKPVAEGGGCKDAVVYIKLRTKCSDTWWEELRHEEAPSVFERSGWSCRMEIPPWALQTAVAPLRMLPLLALVAGCGRRHCVGRNAVTGQGSIRDFGAWLRTQWQISTQDTRLRKEGKKITWAASCGAHNFMKVKCRGYVHRIQINTMSTALYLRVDSALHGGLH